MGFKEKAREISHRFTPKAGLFTLGAILVVVLNLLITYSFLTPKLNFKEGQVADRTIKASRTVVYESKIRTDEAKDKAAGLVAKVYRFDPTIPDQQVAKNTNVFHSIDSIRTDGSKTVEDKIGAIGGLESMSLSDDNVKSIANASEEEWTLMKQEVSSLLLSIQETKRVKNDEDVDISAMTAPSLAERFNDPQKAVINGLISTLLLPNEYYDGDQTEKQREEAKGAVSSVYSSLNKDEVLLFKGEVINDVDLEKLEALGLLSTSSNVQKTLSTFVIVTILAILSALYFYFFPVKGTSFTKSFSLFSLLLIIMVLVARTVLPLKPIMAYLLPVAAPVILITLLLSFEAGIFSSIIFPLAFGIIAGSSFELFVIHLVASLIGVFSVRKNITRLSGLFGIGILLILANFFISVAFHFWAGSFSLNTATSLFGAAMIYGVSAVVIVIGGLVILGSWFDIVTFWQLLELENPNHPLIKEISLKAPGTYYHSVLVSSLAERAAEAIGADPLLTRVGAYYHDVGKILCPKCFVENKGNWDSREKNNLMLNAKKIISHTENGGKLGRDYHLPPEIINIIESHHGTTTALYFWEKEKERNKNADKREFSYNGPKPATKEAAIVMLADSVEATVHSLKRPSQKEVEKTVDESVASRIEDGQLADADLTFSDLSRIKKSFKDTLKMMNHERIEYPKVTPDTVKES